ncbi:MAG: hypothetical protein DDT42_01869 [candidate division WS2 bacterium]|uniref:Uncharacterized protein n=1 Tax=Psychracetigena formicireducens TaxID=2986056 RepID=A0A9E2BK44_PSYF1|nr:hypothetical protein [Candidatus Psychracetigena formicireducens]
MPFFIKQFPELKVNYVVSDSVLVYMNRLVSKKIAIKIDTSKVLLTDNIALDGQILIEPDSIEITGANTLIERFPNWLKLELPIKRLSSDYSEIIPINVRDYNYIKFKKKSVKVQINTIQLEPKSIFLNLEKSPIYNYSDTAFEVKLYYEQSIADTLTKLDTNALKLNLEPVLGKDKVGKLVLETVPVNVKRYEIIPSTINKTLVEDDKE